MSEAWVVLETSGRGGQVGLAVGGHVVAESGLDPARRHNRDLIPAVAAVVAGAGMTPADLHGVMVGVGPGSFTGLRVGVMTAKSLAWALDCHLVAVPTFLAVAEQSPAEATIVDVISDALKGMVYAQQFRRHDNRWQPASELRIESASEWASRLPPHGWISGPGVELHADKISGRNPVVPDQMRTATATGVFRAGRMLTPLGRPEVAGLEPLYLRPSSAEEAAARKAQ